MNEEPFTFGELVASIVLGTLYIAVCMIALCVTILVALFWLERRR